MDVRDAALRLGNAVVAHTAALLFLNEDTGDGPSIANNATVSFVDTGDARLIVTNAHVIQAYDKKVAAGDPIAMCVGGGGARTSLRLERSWVRDFYSRPDLRLDLATFVVPDAVDLSHFGKHFYTAPIWPPDRAVVGDFVVICGFPGQHRSQQSSMAIMNITVLADPVSSVNDHSFTLADETQERVMVRLNPTLKALGSFGGMSGSPAFKFTSNGDHQLVGILHESHDGLNAQFRATHADFICSDGTLDYGRVGY